MADLSTFAESGGQLPGTYRVTVFVNGEKQGDAQDIAFTDGAEKKLSPQITPAMLKAWGVKTDVFPALAALPPDQPLDDIGRYIPMATTDLRFSKLQLNVSIPQAALSTAARGWVDPLNGTKASPPRCSTITSAAAIPGATGKTVRMITTTRTCKVVSTSARGGCVTTRPGIMTKITVATGIQ